MSDNSAEAELLVRASRGDETAFLVIYERHCHSIFRFAYRLLGSVQLAEDVTHDCFLALLRRPEGYQAERASLRTYLCAATRNLAFRLLRKRGVETLVDDVPEPPSSNRTPEQLRNLLGDEIIQTVRQAVEALPPLQREALILFEYEDLSLAEIAQITESDVGTVKSRLHRARQRLRRRLGPLCARPSMD
ncbi:MAG: RNA polymerase sigma factor [Vicinamibacteria bacterium]|nr:RNA polymerase sigma factor [Vicinamibacteria bacterium]